MSEFTSLRFYFIDLVVIVCGVWVYVFVYLCLVVCLYVLIFAIWLIWLVFTWVFVGWFGVYWMLWWVYLVLVDSVVVVVCYIFVYLLNFDVWFIVSLLWFLDWFALSVVDLFGYLLFNVDYFGLECLFWIRLFLLGEPNSVD